MNNTAATEICSGGGADDVGIANGPYMAYHAPVDDPDTGLRKSLRRNCVWGPDQCSGFVEPGTGKVRVKVVHHTIGAFKVDVDLLQLMSTDDSSVGAGIAQQPVPGADLNYDDQVSLEDVELFLTAYSEAAPLADINSDDAVMTDDVVLFAEFLSGGMP